MTMKIRKYAKRGVKGWEVDINVRLPTGEVVRERVKSPATGRTATDKWAREREETILAQGGREPKEAIEKESCPTLGSYISDWLKERERGGKVSHVDDVARLRDHVTPVLGRYPLDELRPKQIRAWLLSLRDKPSPRGDKLAPRTIRTIYFVLRRVLRDAVVDELIVSSPCMVKTGDLPPNRDKDSSWRQSADFAREEVETLISDERIPEVRRVAYAIEFLTGARTSEVSGLRWRDLSGAQPLGRIIVARGWNTRAARETSTKTEVEHWIPVHPVLAKILAGWKLTGWRATFGRAPKPDDLIVPGREAGEHRNVDVAGRQFGRDLRKVGIEKGKRRHYDARSWFRSTAICDGAPEHLIDAITHPRPREASDGYRRFRTLWPAMCGAVATLRIGLREGTVIPLARASGDASGDILETPGETLATSLRRAPESPGATCS